MQKYLPIVLILAASNAVCHADNGLLLSEEDAKQYCVNIGGTPELFRFVAIRHSGVVEYTGVEQYWCNLHVGVDETDTTDSHSYIEVRTLANPNLTLAGYALAHPEPFTAPSDGSNPAYHYCKQMNGTLPGQLEGYSQVGWVKEGNGLNMYGGCVFADGSTINQWTLTYAQFYRKFATNLLAHFKSKS